MVRAELPAESIGWDLPICGNNRFASPSPPRETPPIRSDPRNQQEPENAANGGLPPSVAVFNVSGYSEHFDVATELRKHEDEPLESIFFWHPVRDVRAYVCAS